MSEENNNQGKGIVDNVQQKGNEISQGVKDGTSLAKNAASGNYLGAAKDAINLAKNKTVRRKVIINGLISIISPILIICLIASLILGIFEGVGDALQSALEGIKEIFTVDYDNNGIINITDEALDEIIKSIKSTGVSLDDLHLMGDVDYNNPDIEERNEKALKKYIRQFYEAQVVTQTLYTNPAWYERVIGATYGTVYVRRTKDNDKNLNDLEQLEYISYDKMKEMQAKQNKNIKKYFSVDESDRLVIANLTQTITEENNGQTKNETIIGLQTIDYKTAISQYTTPMNFFIYLTMITQNAEFASAVAELAKNSEIQITLMDSVSTNVTEEVRRYTENTITVTNTHTQANVSQPATSQEISERKKTTVITTIPMPSITHVKTWFCEQTIEYIKKDTPASSGEPHSTEPKNESQPAINGEGTYKWKTNDITTITTSSSSSYYEESIKGKVLDKTGERGDGKKSFIGLLDVKFRMPNTTKEGTASINFVNGADMFLQLLQKDANLQTVEDIIRYILYKYTGNSYGVDKFDFNIFGIKDFSTIGSSGSALLREYIRKWEHSSPPPTNTDGTKYIIETDGKGHPTVGYGVDIENSGYKSAFITAGYPTNIGGEVPIEFVDSLEDMIINDKTSGLESYTSGINLTGYQKNALISRCYNMGTAGGVGKEYSTLNFAESYKTYWNQETDDMYKDKNPHANFQNKLYRNYMSIGTYSEGEYVEGLENRRRSEWTLFQTGYYDVLDKWHVDGGTVTNVNGDGYSTTYTSTATGRTYNEYRQNMGSYKNSGFFGGTIETVGCSVTSISIAISGYGFNDNPSKVSMGYSGMSGWLSKYSSKITIEKYHASEGASRGMMQQKAIEALQNGKEIIFSLEGYNPGFVDGTHYITLLDIKDGNQVYVSNPHTQMTGGWVNINDVTRNNCLEDIYIISQK